MGYCKPVCLRVSEGVHKLRSGTSGHNTTLSARITTTSHILEPTRPSCGTALACSPSPHCPSPRYYLLHHSTNSEYSASSKCSNSNSLHVAPIKQQVYHPAPCTTEHQVQHPEPCTPHTSQGTHAFSHVQPRATRALPFPK